jgi:hypothetical protein
MGIRIEDEVLITRSGHEVSSVPCNTHHMQSSHYFLAPLSAESLGMSDVTLLFRILVAWGTAMRHLESTRSLCEQKLKVI